MLDTYKDSIIFIGYKFCNTEGFFSYFSAVVIFHKNLDLFNQNLKKKKMIFPQ